MQGHYKIYSSAYRTLQCGAEPVSPFSSQTLRNLPRLPHSDTTPGGFAQRTNAWLVAVCRVLHIQFPPDSQNRSLRSQSKHQMEKRLKKLGLKWPEPRVWCSLCMVGQLDGIKVRLRLRCLLACPCAKRAHNGSKSVRIRTMLRN